MKNYVENDFASMWMEDNILFFTFKENVDIDLPGAKKIVADRLTLQRGKACPILCRLRGIRSVDQSARRYLVSEGSGLIKAVALISTSPLENAFSKFYIKRMPSIPIEVFEKVDKAKEYLLHHMGSQELGR